MLTDRPQRRPPRQSLHQYLLSAIFQAMHTIASTKSNSRSAPDKMQATTTTLVIGTVITLPSPVDCHLYGIRTSNTMQTIHTTVVVLTDRLGMSIPLTTPLEHIHTQSESRPFLLRGQS